MSLLYRTILRPAVFLQDSEKAHSRILSMLERTSRSRLLTSILGNIYGSPELPTKKFSLDFPNPLHFVWIAFLRLLSQNLQLKILPSLRQYQY